MSTLRFNRHVHLDDSLAVKSEICIHTHILCELLTILEFLFILLHVLLKVLLHVLYPSMPFMFDLEIPALDQCVGSRAGTRF